jgi:hypothetical protein
MRHRGFPSVNYGFKETSFCRDSAPAAGLRLYQKLTEDMATIICISCCTAAGASMMYASQQRGHADEADQAIRT